MLRKHLDDPMKTGRSEGIGTLEVEHKIHNVVCMYFKYLRE